ncbi:response regulator [Paenibacillus ginsengarvi]|uniref:Response regulator n=2 Tax=Paenibacillus ginsengarvi TaxID=400777 RepID=A0A3B0B2M5_9BACL|nr:response regulator [Paenibacillus ginsengarvi]
MKEGKIRFLSEMQKQVNEMERLLDRIADGDDASLPAQLYRYAHTLKGSAPIFGFASVGAVAARIADQWEWALEEEQNKASVCFVRKSVPGTKADLMQLKMEWNILQRELLTVEQNGQGDWQPAAALSGTLLVVDDDAALRSFLVRRLELDGYSVHEADSVDSAKLKLRERTYDLILLDLMMFPLSGYELFDELKEDPTLKWVPLIVLSARSDVRDKVRCLMLGANDYVTKPFEYDELAARIYSLLSRTRNFEQLAFRDPLTGVFNRRYFDHQLELELQRLARDPAPISIAFIDIDRFKRVNDTYGHAIGDLVLQGLAHLMQQHLRPTDFLARFGGEEFVAVMPNTTGEQAVSRMESVLQLARQQPIAEFEGQSFSITFSCGVAEWVPSLPMKQWVVLADEAMYRAKEQGRDQVVLAGYPEEAAQRISTEAGAGLKRVLIADDDSILRSMLASRLKKLPLQVAEAADGEEAFRYLSGNEVDLCILDGVMPKLDGFGLLERMKSDAEGRFRNTRILMLSGKKREEDIAKALRLGASDYMSKPFSLIELEMRVTRLLETER